MQRIDLAEIEHTVLRRWQSSGGATVAVGTCGRCWFAWHSRKGAAWVADWERSTAEIADQWPARGRWTEISPAGQGEPGTSDPAAQERG